MTTSLTPAPLPDRDSAGPNSLTPAPLPEGEGRFLELRS